MGMTAVIKTKGKYLINDNHIKQWISKENWQCRQQSCCCCHQPSSKTIHFSYQLIQFHLDEKQVTKVLCACVRGVLGDVLW